MGPNKPLPPSFVQRYGNGAVDTPLFCSAGNAFAGSYQKIIEKVRGKSTGISVGIGMSGVVAARR